MRESSPRRPSPIPRPRRASGVAGAIAGIGSDLEQAARDIPQSGSATQNPGAFVPPTLAGELTLSAVGSFPVHRTARLTAPGRGTAWVAAFVNWGTDNYVPPGGTVTGRVLSVAFGFGASTAQLDAPLSGITPFPALVQLNTDFTLGATFDTVGSAGGTIDVSFDLLGVSALLPNVRLSS